MVAGTMKWVVSLETEESVNDGSSAVWEIESDHICPTFVIVFLSKSRVISVPFLALKSDQNEAEDYISNFELKYKIGDDILQILRFAWQNLPKR